MNRGEKDKGVTPDREKPNTEDKESSTQGTEMSLIKN
jgi:hypothetical protein